MKVYGFWSDIFLCSLLQIVSFCGIGTHTWTVSYLCGCMLCACMKACRHFFVKPGTHHCWVDNSSAVWEVCPNLLHMTCSGIEPQTFWSWVLPSSYWCVMCISCILRRALVNKLQFSYLVGRKIQQSVFSTRNWSKFTQKEITYLASLKNRLSEI